MLDADHRTLEVLLVDDNPADVLLTQEALKDGDVPCRLTVVRTGAEAMALLRRQAPFADAARPSTVLLDLGLPDMEGQEVLADIKRDPELRAIPVVVLTGSRAEEDVVRAYHLHACSYIVKPLEPVDLVKALEPAAG